jgi:hypothetical protein
MNVRPFASVTAGFMALVKLLPDMEASAREMVDPVLVQDEPCHLRTSFLPLLKHLQEDG